MPCEQGFSVLSSLSPLSSLHSQTLIFEGGGGAGGVGGAGGAGGVGGAGGAGGGERGFVGDLWVKESELGLWRGGERGGGKNGRNNNGDNNGSNNSGDNGTNNSGRSGDNNGGDNSNTNTSTPSTTGNSTNTATNTNNNNNDNTGNNSTNPTNEASANDPSNGPAPTPPTPIVIWKEGQQEGLPVGFSSLTVLTQEVEGRLGGGEGEGGGWVVRGVREKLFGGEGRERGARVECLRVTSVISGWLGRTVSESANEVAKRGGGADAGKLLRANPMREVFFSFFSFLFFLSFFSLTISSFRLSGQNSFNASFSCPKCEGENWNPTGRAPSSFPSSSPPSPSPVSSPFCPL